VRAKLFRNGRSQAVRLPANCRFEGTEVEVERDPLTGVVSLRPLRSTPLEWLRQRAALLDEDPQAAADGFAGLVQSDDVSGPAQERGWP
jgi:antitoxin VapB